MKHAWFLLLCVAGCSSSTELLPDGGFPDLGNDWGVVFPPRAAPVCNGVACTGGEICCFATGRCFDPDASTCVGTGVDAGDGTGGTIDPRGTGGPPTVCGSDADCRDDQFCNGDTCGGAGLCYPRDNCGSCFTMGGTPDMPGDPGPGTVCQICGCNGVTYDAIQQACAAGVRVTQLYTSGGACGGPPTPSGNGRIPCGNDAQCPSGSSCCAYYGFCMPTDCTYCCAPPPPGATLPCMRNEECRGEEYCAGDGCGTVGGCMRTVSTSECGGELDEVCGCDGVSYTNACWALAARTRVASHGRCPGT